MHKRRWSIWILAILAHTIGMFHRAALAPMADRIMADFGITAVAFGSLGAAYYYAYAAMQIPTGTLADWLGPRKTITGGMLLALVGSLFMGMASSFWVIYAGRLIASIGVSVVWLNIIKLLMRWFHTRELATMTGISAAAINLGQIAATTPLAFLVVWAGWRMSFLSLGVVTLVLAICTWLIIRDSPEQVGLPSIFELEGDPPVQISGANNTLQLGLARKFKTVFSDKNVWLLFLLGFGVYGAYGTLFQNWAAVYFMQTYGLSRPLASSFALVATVGNMVGCSASGFISDRVLHRRRLPAIIFSSITLTALLLLVFWNGGKPPNGALYPLSFFIGFGNGATILTFVCLGEVVQPSNRGLASGLVNMGPFAAATIAQPLVGYFLDLGWTGELAENAHIYPQAAFQHGFFVVCALAALGVLSALLLKETYRHKI